MFGVMLTPDSWEIKAFGEYPPNNQLGLTLPQTFQGLITLAFGKSIPPIHQLWVY